MIKKKLKKGRKRLNKTLKAGRKRADERVSTGIGFGGIK